MAGSVLFLPILGFDSPMGLTLFTGKSVGLGASKCPEYHIVPLRFGAKHRQRRGHPEYPLPGAGWAEAEAAGRLYGPRTGTAAEGDHASSQETIH